MLSLMQLLFGQFHQSTIVKEASKALTDAIYHIKMDQVFKENYVFYAFLRLDDVEPVYQRQVYNLSHLWHKLDDVIDRDEFAASFNMHCEHLNLPAVDYDMDIAFHKAQHEWAA